MTHDDKLVASRLVAHRGLQAHYPENSIAGIAAALEAGARAVEVDVQISSDGVAMLYHDLDMERISGLAGTVTELDATTLSEIPAHEPGRLGDRFAGLTISPLSELVPLLEDWPNIICFVEMKPQSVKAFGAAACWAALEAALQPDMNHCIFISFDEDFLAEVKKQSAYRVGFIVEEWCQVAKPPIAVDVIFCDKHLLPTEGELRDPQTPLVVYEVVEPDEARDLLRRGATMVETHNLPGLLLD